MAERIDTDEVVNKGGAPPRYPWHEWMDGSRWHLKAGADYVITTKSFRHAIYRHASRTGHTAQVHRVADGLTVKFTPKKTEEGT